MPIIGGECPVGQQVKSHLTTADWHVGSEEGSMRRELTTKNHNVRGQERDFVYGHSEFCAADAVTEFGVPASFPSLPFLVMMFANHDSRRGLGMVRSASSSASL